MSKDSQIVEYSNADGLTQGVYADSELDCALASSPDWELVGERPSAPESADAAEVGVEPEDSDESSEPEDGVEGEPSGSPEDPDLSDLTREELDALAAEVGVENPVDLPNKSAVIEAIKAAE